VIEEFAFAVRAFAVGNRLLYTTQDNVMQRGLGTSVRCLMYVRVSLRCSRGESELAKLARTRIFLAETVASESMAVNGLHVPNECFNVVNMQRNNF
jgi:hypothetical protein